MDSTEIDHFLGQIRPRVYRQVLASTGDRDTAEDLCQEVLILVFKGLPSFRGEAMATSWIHRITCNTIGGFFRRESCEAQARQRWIREVEQHQGEWRPDHAFDLRTLWRLARGFAEDLPQAQREAFGLSHFHGLPSAEIAARSGRCPGTVRANLHKARRKLKNRILSECPLFAIELLEQPKRR